MFEPNVTRIQVDVPVETARKARALAALAGVKLSTYCADALKAFEDRAPDKVPPQAA